MTDEIGIISLKTMKPREMSLGLVTLNVSVGFLALLFGLVIQVRLYFLMKSKKDRGINSLILTQQVRVKNCKDWLFVLKSLFYYRLCSSW